MKEIISLARACLRLDYTFSGLALPTYVLPFNFDFASVVGLDHWDAFQILEIDFRFGPISEQREWLRTITLMSCANWVCTTSSAQPLLSHIYLFIFIIIFAPLKLGQYLDYIENVDVKSFVLVSIELLVSEFTFRCTV